MGCGPGVVSVLLSGQQHLRKVNDEAAHACSNRRARAYAHCDLPCGVYDPAQARVEADPSRRLTRSTSRTPTRVPRPRADHGEAE